MEYKDYYQVLGVPKNADQATIKKAYRKLARKHHPDFNKGNKAAEQKFKEINEAYQVLGDSQKRAKYDQLGADWDKYQQFQGSPFDFGPFRQEGGARFQNFTTGKEPGFSDFFRTFFGDFDLFGPEEEFPTTQRKTRRSGTGRTREASAEIRISLREAVLGANKTFTMTEETICSQCRGKGGSSVRVCAACRGSGTITKPTDIEVTIPAGVQNGSRVRLRGKGHTLSGSGQRGDLFLVVKILEDPNFRIVNRDLHNEVPVTLYEAVLGAEIDVPTASGKVRMRIPPETQNGQIFRLKGKGLPALGRHPTGDQIIRVRIVLPKGLTLREKELFQQLAQLRVEDPHRGQ